MKYLRKFNESHKDIPILLMGVIEEIESEYEKIRCDVSHGREKSTWYIEMDKYPKEERGEIIHKISVGLEEIMQDFKCHIEAGYFIEDWKWINKPIKSINDLIRLRVSNKLVSKLKISIIYDEGGT